MCFFLSKLYPLHKHSHKTYPHKLTEFWKRYSLSVQFYQNKQAKNTFFKISLIMVAPQCEFECPLSWVMPFYIDIQRYLPSTPKSLYPPGGPVPGVDVFALFICHPGRPSDVSGLVQSHADSKSHKVPGIMQISKVLKNKYESTYSDLFYFLLFCNRYQGASSLIGWVEQVHESRGWLKIFITK